MTEANVVEYFEIDQYVQQLQAFPINEILSDSWNVQGCRLIQLCIQATLESNQNREEYVLHKLILESKLPVLMWELISIEAWKVNVLPEILKSVEGAVTSTLPVSLLMQTDTSISTLFEQTLHSGEDPKNYESIILDIIDWSVRQITTITAKIISSRSTFSSIYTREELVAIVEFSKKDDRSEIQHAIDDIKQEKSTNLLVSGLRALGILSQITLKRNDLPLCCTSRLLRTQDVPQLLASLISADPWKIIYNENIYRFTDGHWAPDISDNGPPLQRWEIQAWITIHSLLLDHQNLGQYPISSARQAALLKIRPKLTGKALQQVPILNHLAKSLTTLSVCNPQEHKNPPLITTLPEIGDAPAKEWNARWKELGVIHATRALKLPPDSLKELATRFSRAWDFDAMETLAPELPRCAVCHELAGRRCSKCKGEWYCRRECQVKHWNRHKGLCDLLSEKPTTKKDNFIS